MRCFACSEEVDTSYSYPEGSIYTCGNCCLQWAVCNDYLHAQVGGEMEGSYYMRAESIKNLTGYKPYDEFFRNAREMIPGNTPLKILDVGCGNGMFIQSAVERGHDAIGVELNEKYQDFMSEELAQKITFGKPAEALDYSAEGKFDCICFWDCFEHIPDGFTLIDKLAGNLKPEGFFYLRVNNRRDIFNFISDVSLKIFPAFGKKLLRKCFNFPAHAWNFSYKSLLLMLHKHQWELLRHKFSDTPSDRLTDNGLVSLAFNIAYLFNRVAGGGKIGNYYIKKGEGNGPN